MLRLLVVCMACIVCVSALSLRNPTEFANLRTISIAAGKVQVKQDARFSTLLPFQAQELPLDYCSTWPLWVVGSEGKLPVTRIPMPAKDADPLSTWVPPAGFEQLWMPQDLPSPQAQPAIALVLRDGTPRYILPTIDTFIEADGVTWRNRGLNTVPLGKTWLHYGESPSESLRLSAYVLPSSDEATAGGESDLAEGDPKQTEPGTVMQERAWVQCLHHVPVQEALDRALDALDNLPPLLKRASLGDGFCYLLSPLKGSCAALPPSALEPGARLRVFLSDIDMWPTNVARDQGAEPTSADEDSWMWQRGELDLTMWEIPPGRESPYLPAPYAPLYNHQW